MPRVAAVTLLALALGAPGFAGEPKQSRPRLDLRATPRNALTPVTVFATAELIGGQDAEDYHCPAIEWEWGDGGRSAHEADCAPFAAGTSIERRYTAEHQFRRPGMFSVRVTMRRAGRTIAVAMTTISVRGGFAGLRN